MTPSTPPEGSYYNSDSSIDSILSEVIPQPSKPLAFESLLDTTLLDDSLFLFSPQNPGIPVLSRWENRTYPSAI